LAFFHERSDGHIGGAWMKCALLLAKDFGEDSTLRIFSCRCTVYSTSLQKLDGETVLLTIPFHFISER